MSRVKSNQGYRERRITQGFIDSMRKLQGIMATSKSGGKTLRGPFEFEFKKDEFYSLRHDGDLVARWDCLRQKQFGALSQIETAIEHLVPIDSDVVQDRALVMIKKSTTMLNNALNAIKADFPDSGISYSSQSLLILRDINVSETPANTLLTIPLASAVRSIL